MEKWSRLIRLVGLMVLGCWLSVPAPAHAVPPCEDLQDHFCSSGIKSCLWATGEQGRCTCTGAWVCL